MGRGSSFARARVLVTGGGNGLGRLLALGSAERGAEVVIWDIAADAAERVCSEIRSAGGRAEFAAVDVTDQAAVAAAAEKAGAIDILLNNAGIVDGKPLLDATDEEIRRTFEVNTLSLYWVTRAFLGGMLARDRGAIVTIASAAGMVGVAQQTDYSASKFAAVGFDESLRAELRTQGSRVRTFIVCPYYIDTGMFDGVRTRFPRLLPILDEQKVATAVLDGIESGRRRLVLPALVRLLPAGRLFPVPVFDKVMDVLGVNQTMTHFTGRKT